MRPRPSRSSRSSTPPMRAHGVGVANVAMAAAARRISAQARTCGEAPRSGGQSIKMRQPNAAACSASSINSRNARWAGGSSMCRAVSIAVRPATACAMPQSGKIRDKSCGTSCRDCVASAPAMPLGRVVIRLFATRRPSIATASRQICCSSVGQASVATGVPSRSMR